MLLEVSALSKAFGGVQALNNVSFGADEGRVTAIIGPNGAGKTTLFNLLSGIYRPSSGSVRLRGVELAGKRPHQIARLGLSRTFQHLRLFENMSVLENVLVGRHLHTSYGWFGAAFRPPAARQAERRSVEVALLYLDLVGLRRRAHEPAIGLSFGEQRLLELARALASEPTLLLLDEPGAGLSAEETAELAAIFRALSRRGVGVLFVEHDMALVMGVAATVIVLDLGEKIAEGAPDRIQVDERVIAAYLGTERHARAEA